MELELLELSDVVDVFFKSTFCILYILLMYVFKESSALVLLQSCMAH